MRQPVIIALVSLGVATAPASAGAAPVDFAREATIGAGDLPYAVETADLNGDGALDAVVPNTISDDVTVLLGRGDGTFARSGPFPGGDGPRDAASGDFDEDGAVDVAVTNVYARGVSVLRGNGRGGFGPPVRHGVGREPRTVVALDADGDGHADLATVDRVDDTVSVLLGRGDGSFAPARSHPAGDRRSAGSDGDAYDLTSLDADADGDPDLAVANRASNNVSILIGAGDGSFRPGPVHPVGRTPYDVAAADLDGNGAPDLAVANGDSRDVSILLGRGDGSFERRPSRRTGAPPFALAIADLDADGDPDLAVANNPNTTYVDGKDYAGSASILLGRGDGTFGPPREHGVGPRPVAIAAHDLDADGRVDLATANRGSDDVSVLLLLRGGGLRLSLRPSRRRVAWPATVTLRGRLTAAAADDRPLAGRRVVLERRPWVRGAFALLPGQPPGGVRVAADGTFSLPGVRPEWTTDYRARVAGPGGASRRAAVSALATVEGRVRVSLDAPTGPLRLGASRLLTGSVSHHSHAGLPVSLEIRRDGELERRTVATLDPGPGCRASRAALCPVAASLTRAATRPAGGRRSAAPGFRFAFRPARPGSYSIVARFGGHPPGHLGNESPPVRFRVKG